MAATGPLLTHAVDDVIEDGGARSGGLRDSWGGGAFAADVSRCGKSGTCYIHCTVNDSQRKGREKLQAVSTSAHPTSARPHLVEHVLTGVDHHVPLLEPRRLHILSGGHQHGNTGALSGTGPPVPCPPPRHGGRPRVEGGHKVGHPRGACGSERATEDFIYKRRKMVGATCFNVSVPATAAWLCTVSLGSAGGGIRRYNGMGVSPSGDDPSPAPRGCARGAHT